MIRRGVTVWLLAVGLLAGCTLDIGVEAGRTATASRPPAARAVAGVSATEPAARPTRTPRPSATGTPTPTARPTATRQPTVPPVRSGGVSPPRATARPTARPTLPPITTLPPTLPPTATPVDPEAAAIATFNVTPASAEAGDTVMLVWEAAGRSVALRTELPGGGAGPAYGGLPLAGSLEVMVEGEDGDTLTYVLEVAGAGGTAEAARVTLTVGACAAAWFFEPPPDGCPRGPAETYASAIQHFERGFMIWDAGSRSILVFFADAAGGWSQYADGWSEGMPESDPGIAPPEGLYQPVRGFGLLWRTASSSGGPIRDRLGWAIGPEHLYTRTEQFAADAEDRNLHVYQFVSRSDGQVIVLLGGAWALWPSVP